MVNTNKIRRLEKHVLPEFPEPAVLSIKNESEVALFTKAQAIRERLYSQVSAIVYNDSLTFAEKTEKAEELYNSINPVELTILTKDHDFLVIRLHNILFEFFKTSFPKVSEVTIHTRILWFFREMDKLALKEQIEDSEFTHNRDEDTENFDDFAWWERVDALTKADFPEGVFTEATYEKVRDEVDVLQSNAIRKYWIDHPGEYEPFMKKLKNLENETE